MQLIPLSAVLLTVPQFFYPLSLLVDESPSELLKHPLNLILSLMQPPHFLSIVFGVIHSVDLFFFDFEGVTSLHRVISHEKVVEELPIFVKESLSPS